MQLIPVSQGVLAWGVPRGVGPAEAWSALAAQAGGHVASSPHAGELGTVLVSGTEMQEGQKVLEASQACSVCGVKPGAQCQMWLPFKVGGATGKEGAHRLSWPEDCVRRLWERYRGDGYLLSDHGDTGLCPPAPPT